MKDTASMAGQKPERVSDNKELEQQWQLIDWETAQTYVNRLQVRIAKAVKAEKWSKVKRLQYLLTHSYYAKLLSVKKVTTNKGKKTPGIDGEIWSTSAAKMKAVYELTDVKYKAKPVRRVFIEKKGKKEKRPLGIPCMYDRAMQALHTLALEPIAEITADRNSFGFRSGRCAQDASAEIFGVLSQKRAAQYILEGDIKGCFDNISHQWMMDNIPMEKKILSQFLKAGYAYKGDLYPTENGAAQGSVIGPTLANMTLDGLQEKLYGHFRKTKRQANKHKVNFIRFADDFIVTAANKQIAEEARSLIEEFLTPRGLELSEQKTVITEIHQGFDFLGWTFRKYKDTMIIKPSRKSVRSVFTNVHDIIKKGIAGKQDDIIIHLNPVLRGWANYHQSVCAKATFQRMGHQTFLYLWAWAKRRHPDKGRHWRKDRYWENMDTRAWVFKTETHTLCNVASTPIVRHPRLKTDMNPFMNPEYFYNRQTKLTEKKKNAKDTAALNRVCNA